VLHNCEEVIPTKAISALKTCHRVQGMDRIGVPKIGQVPFTKLVDVIGHVLERYRIVSIYHSGSWTQDNFLYDLDR
jgi:hypothetical protein